MTTNNDDFSGIRSMFRFLIGLLLALPLTIWKIIDIVIWIIKFLMRHLEIK